MEIRLFQLIVPAIALLFVAGIVTRYTGGRINLRELVFSVVFWLGVGIFAIFPDRISNFVAEVFGIKSNVNAVLFLGIGILLYLQFMMYAEIKENRRKLTIVTRELALRDAEKEEK